jgi:hypothetical protein
MTDLELAQQALPKGFAPDVSAWLEVNTDNEVRNSMLDMFLAGMAKAREIDAEICEKQKVNKSPDYFPGQVFDGACVTCANAIRSQGKK